MSGTAIARRRRLDFPTTVARVVAELAQALPDLTTCPVCLTPIAGVGSSVLLTTCLHAVCTDCAGQCGDAGEGHGDADADNEAWLQCPLCEDASPLPANAAATVTPLQRHPLIEPPQASVEKPDAAAAANDDAVIPEVAERVQALVATAHACALEHARRIGDAHMSVADAKLRDDAVAATVNAFCDALRDGVERRRTALLENLATLALAEQRRREDGIAKDGLQWCLLTSAATIAEQALARPQSAAGTGTSPDAAGLDHDFTALVEARLKHVVGASTSEQAKAAVPYPARMQLTVASDQLDSWQQMLAQLGDIVLF